MIRKAFKMTLFEGKIIEYKKRHNPIWNDLKAVLKSHGAHNYSIFFDDETHSLFVYVEMESEEKWNAIAQTEVCKKWWVFMKDMMETNADNSPVSKELKSLFYLE